MEMKMNDEALTLCCAFIACNGEMSEKDNEKYAD